MPGRYVHLVNADVDDAVLSHYGIVKGKQQGPAMPKSCSICGMANSVESNSCTKCGRPLDLGFALDLEEKQNEKDKKIEEQAEKIASLEKQMIEVRNEWKNLIKVNMSEPKIENRFGTGPCLPVRVNIS